MEWPFLVSIQENQFYRCVEKIKSLMKNQWCTILLLNVGVFALDYIINHGENFNIQHFSLQKQGTATEV